MQVIRQIGNTLLKWLEEFQSKDSHISHGTLAEDFGSEGGRLVGHNPRVGRGGSGNGEMHNLVGPENVGGYNARAGSADIESFRQLDKFGPRGVGGAQENGHLQANARGSSRVSRIHALTIL